MATTPTSPWGARRREILASAARTATGNSDTLTGIERYTSFVALIDVTANGGTSQTLDVAVQTLLPDGITWQPLAQFQQFTTSNLMRVASVVSGGDSIGDVDTTLAAGTIKDFVLGDTFRVRFVIGGTNPSFTFAVFISLYP
ncbi:hypothetical protein LCGC14_1362190 [marine sediment metagenome]|uniref:Uncharacterized protein n=1 Tax=marine sediment metagenome TaxID=412755 RepID=A0A0F9N9Y1_9ZZZZ